MAIKIPEKVKDGIIYFIRFATTVALIFAFVVETIKLAQVSISEKLHSDLVGGILPGTDVPAGGAALAGVVLVWFFRSRFPLPPPIHLH